MEITSNKEKPFNETGKFAASILLTQNEWDQNELINGLQNITKTDINFIKNSDDMMIFDFNGNRVVLTKIPLRLPNASAELAANENYLWKEAKEIAINHTAHIFIAVVGLGNNIIERATLFAHVISVCCKQNYASAIYYNKVLFEPKLYIDLIETTQNNELPIFNWIWFQLNKSSGTISCCTRGLKKFGLSEIEVLNAKDTPAHVRDYLALIVNYILENNISLDNETTLNIPNEKPHRIEFNKSKLSSEPMTIKISYDPIQQTI